MPETKVKPRKEHIAVEPETHQRLKYIVGCTGEKFLGTIVDTLVENEYNRVKAAEAEKLQGQDEESVL